MIIIDGKLVASKDRVISMTQDDYDKLSETDKNNGDGYFITDNTYEELTNLLSKIGSPISLANCGYDSLVDATLSLYNKWKNITFTVSGNVVTTTYTDPKPDTVLQPLNPMDTNKSISENIDIADKILGDYEKLVTVWNYDNVISAIRYIFLKTQNVEIVLTPPQDLSDYLYDISFKSIKPNVETISKKTEAKILKKYSTNEKKILYTSDIIGDITNLHSLDIIARLNILLTKLSQIKFNIDIDGNVTLTTDSTYFHVDEGSDGFTNADITYNAETQNLQIPSVRYDEETQNLEFI